MAKADKFYKKIQKVPEKLIKEFGRQIRVVQRKITPLSNGGVSSVILTDKLVWAVTKTIKNFMLQDKFYDGCEFSLVFSHDQITFHEGITTEAIIDGQAYTVIRSRYSRPGPYELLGEMTVAKPGSGTKREV